MRKQSIVCSILSRSSENSAALTRMEKINVLWRKTQSGSSLVRLGNGVILCVGLLRAVTLKLKEWDEVFAFIDMVADGLKMAKQTQFSCIYGTGGPMASHICALLLGIMLRKPVLIEYQDPLPFQYSKRFTSLARWVEFWSLQQAKVVFLTRQASFSARKRWRRTFPVYHVYPGANKYIDEEMEIKKSCFKKTEKFAIAHMGFFNGSRNADLLLTAICELLKERPELAGILEIQLYGSCDVKDFSFPDIISRKGRVSRQTSLRMMANVDLLLLIQHRDAVSAETIPSKVYEYLHSGTPILGLVYNNPELRQMLLEAGHDAVNADNIREIKEALLHRINSWLARSETRVQPSPYTPDRAARQIIEIMAK